jgi:hypothetical protein
MVCKKLTSKIYHEMFFRFFAALLICPISLCDATAFVKSYQKNVDGVTFLLNKGVMKIKTCR